MPFDKLDNFSEKKKANSNIESKLLVAKLQIDRTFWPASINFTQPSKIAIKIKLETKWFSRHQQKKELLEKNPTRSEPL